MIMPAHRRWHQSSSLNPPEFRYRRLALWTECAKAVAGSGVCAGLAVVLPVTWFPGGLIYALGGAFAWYGGLTAYRTAMRIVVSSEGLMEQPSGRMLAWREVQGLQLVYYSTRRDREDGWMELTLRSEGRAWRIDSRLDGFQQFVHLVLRATADNRLELDPTTAHNLEALAR